MDFELFIFQENNLNEDETFSERFLTPLAEQIQNNGHPRFRQIIHELLQNQDSEKVERFLDVVRQEDLLDSFFVDTVEAASHTDNVESCDIVETQCGTVSDNGNVTNVDEL